MGNSEKVKDRNFIKKLKDKRSSSNEEREKDVTM
jgi:hypothetical protein